MFDLHRLRMLRELARRGTVTEAARACALTPSAVSQQLALLQREAGSVLFVRQGRRLRLTDAGRLLAGHADRLLADAERARSDLAALAGSVSGPVRLSAFPTAARTLVPRAVARCRAEHPDLRVIMDERETEDGLTALTGHDTDVALVNAYDLLPPVETPGVTLTTLLDEPFVVLLPPDREPPSGPVPLAGLASETWVAPYSDTAGRAALDRACARAGFTPRVDYASNDFTVIIAIVRAGLGVALVPRLALESAADLPLAHPSAEPITRQILLAVRDGATGHPAVRALTSALTAQAEAVSPSEM